MHVSLDCPGCGRRLRVNEQFAGKTVRCPSCGTAYTAPSRRAAAPRGRSAFDDASPEDLYAPCERCGMLVSVPEGDVRAVRCPNCRETRDADLYRLADAGPADAVFAPPAALSPAAVQAPAADPPAPAPPPDRPPPLPAGESSCPECGGPMANDAVLCIACGFNRATGKRLKTVSKRLTRRWDAGNFPLAGRAAVFVFLLAACSAAILVFRDDPQLLVGCLLACSAAVALGGLGLGTFHRVTVTTDPQGTPVLIQNWWIFFVPSGELVTELVDFRTIKLTWRATPPGPAALLIAAGLCVLCGIPAILWYTHLLTGNLFALEILARAAADGEPLVEPLTVYKGRSERMARGIGDALEQIAGLRYG